MKGENFWEFQKNVVLAKETNRFLYDRTAKTGPTAAEDVSAVWQCAPLFGMIQSAQLKTGKY